MKNKEKILVIEECSLTFSKSANDLLDEKHLINYEMPFEDDGAYAEDDVDDEN